uniref:SSD domain-containing protein n=1 Tax=Esox lucius TaxID=8010 RepID=A0A6Q2ZG95_ESOLU
MGARSVSPHHCPGPFMLFAPQVVSGSRHEPGYCAFYDECGRNPSVGGSLIPPIVPCLNYSPARVLGPEHYQELKKVCPMLDRGEGQTTACCSVKQLKSLERSLMMSKALLNRCPSCADNFGHFHCISTCSPNQSVTINVTRTANITSQGTVREAVVAYQAYLSTSFADKAFDSCKSVRIPSTGGLAIGTMCGRYGSALCTPQRWYDFQGDSSNGLAPLDIDFRLIPEGVTGAVPAGIVPYNGTALGCNEKTPTGGEVCSCQDCQASCPVLPPPPALPAPFTIGGVDGYLVICATLLGFLILAFLLIHPSEVTCIDRNSLVAQEFLGSWFQAWGTLIASHPFKVLLASAVVVGAFATGLMYIELTTDPVQLWSAPDSRARKEKDMHDKYFDPFFRTNQLILTAPGRPSYIYDSLIFGKQNFSGIISKDLILELLKLQTRIQFWSDDLNRTASLKDVCFAPLNPSNPSLTDCAVNSLPQYFQNSVDNINKKVNMTKLGVTKEVDWKDHFIYCVNSPLSFKDITDLKMSCMADYGAPVFPFLAVGGYENDSYTNAEALILTFSLNNYPRENVKFNIAMEWEQRFLDILKEYQMSPGNPFTFAYMAERSLEDEINRTTAEDIPIFMISYAVIFVYISVALGEYTSFSRILVDSKFLVGLGGILVVGCSVLASMGFYAWIGIPSSLIILQVVPFLVLAVGADNIFIFVLEYQRDARRPNEKREEQIGRVLGNVAPSMLLCSVSESVCFFLGALSTMPAVRSFALYAALAVVLDFVLQMTAFVALLSLDCKRQDRNRCEVVCCITVKTPAPSKPNEGFLLPIMRKYYAPVLLHPVTRVIVVGVPTYFVTTKGFDFSKVMGMNAVCSSVGCDPFSLTQKIQYASEYPQRSYLAVPANSWVDDFIDWLNPGSGCCRLYTEGPDEGKFCNASESSKRCGKCMEKPDNGVLRPNVTQFNRFLPDFLGNRPDLNVRTNIHIQTDILSHTDKYSHKDIKFATRFMAYHTALTTSREFTAALKTARELAHNITLTMRKINDTPPDFEVFPYTVTYVFYEQYLTIVSEGVFIISLCLLPTFVVCCLLLGMDVRSGTLNLLTIIMITVDTVGVMTLWGIDYNAVALINLVTAVGISVEFVSHMTRSFALSIQPTHIERAKEATATMGSAVFAGVAMTNLPGIVVLAFAKAQLIQIFFFRLNLVITLLGLAHGLIFLPVLLSYFGTFVSQAKGQLRELSSNSLPVYDNMTFENQ